MFGWQVVVTFPSSWPRSSDTRPAARTPPHRPPQPPPTHVLVPCREVEETRDVLVAVLVCAHGVCVRDGEECVELCMQARGR